MFLQLFWSPCLSVLEHKSNLDNPRLVEVILNVLASLLSTYPLGLLFIFMHRSALSTVRSILVTMMASNDYMAEIVSHLAKTLFDRCNGHFELVTELVKEISKLNLSDSGKATNDTRNLSHFLVWNTMRVSSLDTLFRSSSFCSASFSSCLVETPRL